MRLGDYYLRSGDGRPTHAWLSTVAESSILEETLRGETERRDSDNGNLANSLLRGEAVLCFGFLNWEARGRIWRKRISPTDMMPTAIVYVPTTRSIVVACRGSCSNSCDDNAPCVGNIARVGTRRACKTPRDHQPNVVVSSLRVFSVDTLEERPGEAFYMRPGIRITGLARLGVKSTTRISLRSNHSVRQTKSMPRGAGTATDSGERVGQDMNIDTAAAIGGDAIAVACCFHMGDDGEALNITHKGKRNSGMQKHEAGEATVTNSTLFTSGDDWNDGIDSVQDCAATATIVAAFEVVACGNGQGGQLHERCGVGWDGTIG